MKRIPVGVVVGLGPGVATTLAWLITGAHTHFFTVDQRRIETTDPVTALTGYRYEETWEPGLLFVASGLALSAAVLGIRSLAIRVGPFRRR